MAWGFRNRLLLGVGVAVGISALAQLGLGYWVLLRAAEATVQRELLVFAQSLYQALDFTGPLPALKRGGYSLLPFSKGRARVTREGRIYLSYDGPFRFGPGLGLGAPHRGAVGGKGPVGKCPPRLAGGPMVAQGGSIKRWMAVLGLLLLGWGLALELPPLPLPPVPLPKPPVLPPPVTPSPSDQGLQRFYGQVTFSDGQALLVGGVPLLGSSPWMALLVPGMAVEVEGSWEGAGFRLLELRIVAPARFSYCR